MSQSLVCPQLTHTIIMMRPRFLLSFKTCFKSREDQSPLLSFHLPALELVLFFSSTGDPHDSAIFFLVCVFIFYWGQESRFSIIVRKSGRQDTPHFVRHAPYQISPHQTVCVCVWFCTSQCGRVISTHPSILLRGTRSHLDGYDPYDGEGMRETLSWKESLSASCFAIDEGDDGDDVMSERGENERQ